MELSDYHILATTKKKGLEVEYLEACNFFLCWDNYFQYFVSMYLQLKSTVWIPSDLVWQKGLEKVFSVLDLDLAVGPKMVHDSTVP